MLKKLNDKFVQCMEVDLGGLGVGKSVHISRKLSPHPRQSSHENAAGNSGKGLAVMEGRSVTDMTTISIRIAEPRARTTDRVSTQTLPTTSLWTRTMSWLRSTWCVINGGHFKVLHTEPDKLALRCVACGHMSPGWEVGSPRLSRRTPADPDRLRVRRPIAA